VKSFEDNRVLTQPLSPVQPVFLRGMGSYTLESENTIAYELGFREQMTERFSWDLALFYNVYENLRTVDVNGNPYLEFFPPPPHMIVPALIANGGAAETYGVEISANWRVTERWRLSSYYAFKHLQEHGATDDAGLLPPNQAYLRSAWDLRRDLEFDLLARYVDRLSGIDSATGAPAQVPAYITMDLRLAWRPRKHLELAIVGQNLLQDHHQEFPSDVHSYATEVPRGVYSTITYRY